MKFYFLTALVISLFLKSQHYNSQWYNVDNGLPQNTVKDIIKDESGFVWILTNNGVVRYDGNRFLVPNKNISTVTFYKFALSGKDIFSVNHYYKNYIKISDRQVNIFAYKKPPIAPYPPQDGKVYFFINQNSANNKFFPITDFYIIELGEQRYFFGKNTIEYQKDPLSKRVVIGKSFNYAMLKNAFVQKSTVYITDPVHRKTIVICNGKISYDNRPSVYNDPRTKIYWFQSKNQVFVINHGKIYLNEIKDGKQVLHFIVAYKEIENDYIGSMLYDEANQKLYIGSLIKGLNVISLSHFYISQKKVPFADEVVYPALPFSGCSVISQDGTEYFKDTVKKRYSLELLSDDRRLIYDNSGNILYTEFGKLYRRLNKFSYKKGDSLSLDQVSSVHKSNGLLMVGRVYNYTQTNLEIFKDDHFTQAIASIKIPEKVTTVKAYSRDLIFVGSYGGLYLVSLSKKKIIKKLAKNINIKNIIRSASGHYWLTTYSDHGFYLLKNNVLIRMPEDPDRDIASAHTFLEDQKGYFWISTNNGLFKVKEKMLLDFAENKKYPVYYYRYTKLNGLLNNEFNTAYPGCNLLANGDFVFPSMEGFVFFRPGEVKSIYPKDHTLFVERAYSSRENFTFKDKIKVKSNFKLLNIFLDIPYFSDIENIHLQARLTGSSHEQWKNIGSNRMYVMDEDSPGNYTLEIRYLVAEDRFTYKSIPVEIMPLLYQTLWFRILIAAALVTIVLVIVQIRTGFLKGKNKDLKSNLESTDNELKAAKDQLKNESEYKEKIIRSISHDISTPLSFMSYLTQQLHHTEDQEKQKELFEMISKTSEQLFKFTSGLSEYTKLYHTEHIFEAQDYFLDELIEEKKELFEEIAVKKNTEIISYCDKHIKTRISKAILSVIFHNLIDNAVKNTVEGTIIIKAQESDNTVVLKVADTGPGMSDEQMKYYAQMYADKENKEFPFRKEKLGLPMVIRLLKKIGAEISFQKNTPVGTLIVITLKNTLL